MIVTKKIKWVMGHALSAPYVGACNRCHGHNWEAEFSYSGLINEAGMVLDFAEFRKMKQWIDEFLDHRFYVKHNHPILEPYIEGKGEYSDDIEELGLVPVDFNPTSENFAIMLHGICAKLMDLFPDKLSVTVSETCSSSATYHGETL